MITGRLLLRLVTFIPSREIRSRRHVSEERFRSSGGSGERAAPVICDPFRVFHSQLTSGVLLSESPSLEARKPAGRGRMSTRLSFPRCFPPISHRPLLTYSAAALRRSSRIPSVSPGRPRTFRTFRLDLRAPRDAVGELTFQE